MNSNKWVCPACKKPFTSEFNECPNCGVIVSKFLKRQEGGVDMPPQEVATRKVSTRKLPTTALVIISSLCILIIAGGLLYWRSAKQEQARQTAEQTAARIVQEQRAREHREKELLQRISNMEEMQRKEAEEKAKERDRELTRLQFERRKAESENEMSKVNEKYARQKRAVDAQVMQQRTDELLRRANEALGR